MIFELLGLGGVVLILMWILVKQQEHDDETTDASTRCDGTVNDQHGVKKWN